MVLHLPGDLIGSPAFEKTLDDVTLMSLLGVKIVIVCGIAHQVCIPSLPPSLPLYVSPSVTKSRLLPSSLLHPSFLQVDRRLRDVDSAPKYCGDVRITDTLPPSPPSLPPSLSPSFLQVDRRLRDVDSAPKYCGDVRITDSDTLRIVKEEAGFARCEVESILSRGFKGRLFPPSFPPFPPPSLALVLTIPSSRPSLPTLLQAVRAPWASMW